MTWELGLGLAILFMVIVKHEYDLMAVPKNHTFISILE